MSDSAKSPKLRVVSWSVPRSLSSVFTQCISSKDNVEVFFEMYASAAFGGPEQVFKSPGQEPNVVREPKMTFKYVKDLLEAEYPSRDMVFVKDMAYAIDSRYDKIPEGFIHTFLIRHPGRVFPSLVRLAKSFPPFLGDISYKDINPSSGQAYKEQWDLFQHVTTILKQPAIVVDADDLVAHPASIMKQFCEKIGFPYSEDLLKWEPDLVSKNKWHIPNANLMANQFIGQYKRAFGSTHFEGGPKGEPNYDNESDDVKASIEWCLPFFEKMSEHKIRP